MNGQILPTAYCLEVLRRINEKLNRTDDIGERDNNSSPQQ